MLSLGKLRFLILPLLLLFSAGAVAADSGQCPKFIFKNMKNRVENTDNQLYDSSEVDANFSPISCVNQYMRKELSVRMMFFLFGDIVDDSLAYVGVAANEFFGNEEVTQDYEPISSYRIFDVLHSVMASYNIFIFAIIIVLLTLVYAKDLNFTAKSGVAFGDQNVSTGVFATRVTVAGLLFIPIPALYGFSVGQAVMIIIALIGVMLANLIWYLSFSFYAVAVSKALMGVTEVDDAKLAREHSDFMDSAVDVKICDILDRQDSVLEFHNTKGLGKITPEALSSNDYYNCLKTRSLPKTGLSFSEYIQRNDLTFGDEEIALTNFCKKTYNDKADSVRSSCGDISLKSGVDGSDLPTMLDGLTKDAESKASYIVSYYCKNSANKFVGETRSFACLDVTGLSGAFYYDENSPDISTDNSRSLAVYENIKKYQSISVLDEEKDEIIAFIDNIIKKGWLASSLVMLEVSSLYHRIQYKEPEDGTETIDQYKYPYFASFVGDIAPHLGGNASYDDAISDELFFPNKAMQIREYFEGAQPKIEAEGYNGAAYIFSFLLPSSSIDMLFGPKRESCLKNNFKDCPNLGPAPLIPVIIASKETAARSAVGAGLTKGAAFSAEAIANKGSGDRYKNWLRYKTNRGNVDGRLIKSSKMAKVFDLMSKILLIIAFISLIFAYILPIVMFIYFIGNAIGFFISLFKMFVIIPLWGMHHAMSKSGEGLFDDVSYGYKELLNIMLKPSLIIAGVICYLLFISVVYPITFILVLNVWDAFYNNNDGSIVGIVYSAFFIIALAVLFTYVTFKSTKIIYKIPNSSEQWLGLESEKDSMWNEVKDRFVAIAKMTLYRV